MGAREGGNAVRSSLSTAVAVRGRYGSRRFSRNRAVRRGGSARGREPIPFDPARGGGFVSRRRRVVVEQGNGRRESIREGRNASPDCRGCASTFRTAVQDAQTRRSYFRIQRGCRSRVHETIRIRSGQLRKVNNKAAASIVVPYVVRNDRGGLRV